MRVGRTPSGRLLLCAFAALGPGCSLAHGGRSLEGDVERPPPDHGVTGTMLEALQQSSVVDRARVIGFGESTHGTYEFRSVVFETALDLARRGESVVVANEVSPQLGAAMNEWIAGCGSMGFGRNFGVGWLTRGTLELLESARAHNLSSSNCIRVVGVDAPVGTRALWQLRLTGRQCLRRKWMDRCNAVVDDLMRLSPSFGTSPSEAAVRIAELETCLAQREPEGRCDDFEWWVHLLHQTVEIPIDSMKGWPAPRITHLVDRDRLMATNVRYWADRSPKVLFLAHAGHVASVKIPPVHGPDWHTPAGYYLSRELGEDYATVALLFGRGDLAARGCVFGRRTTKRRVRSPRRPSVQKDLGERFSEPVLLSAAEACEGHDCDVLRQHLYCLPRGWGDARVTYSSMDVAGAFDWLGFFPEATADMDVEVDVDGPWPRDAVRPDDPRRREELLEILELLPR